MLRNIKLEIKKIASPVLIAMGVLTVLNSVLSCTLYRDYTVYFDIDAWEIGTEFLGLVFPLFVTVPVCWELYYERRNHFLVYTLPRMDKRHYLGSKWCACALAAFLLMFIPYFISAVFALYVKSPAVILFPEDYYGHIFNDLYTQTPLLYALLLSLWKGLLGVITMTFGFVLALYGKNIFVILTAPFIYVILENFIWSVMGLPMYRFVTAFEPSSLSIEAIHAGSFIAGPLLMCGVIVLIALYYSKLKKRAVYEV
ncbi:ABC-2 family transporter protein [Oxobacter pfennigii]|uniref:ABC-2 family transporter protein n=1 Tax=Oxobacter pfennigii TaxID=36849 RepID=A0A0P8X1R9_9CLOT|nr:hypothetical protein [Oxobacter pfennigii]KPU44758.1 ABC-2 family transporter protein [Oxobacter pfennigii]